MLQYIAPCATTLSSSSAYCTWHFLQSKKVVPRLLLAANALETTMTILSCQPGEVSCMLPLHGVCRGRAKTLVIEVTKQLSDNLRQSLFACCGTAPAIACYCHYLLAAQCVCHACCSNRYYSQPKFRYSPYCLLSCSFTIPGIGSCSSAHVDSTSRRPAFADSSKTSHCMFLDIMTVTTCAHAFFSTRSSSSASHAHSFMYTRS